MYRQPLRLLTVLCLLGIAPAFAAQVSAVRALHHVGDTRSPQQGPGHTLHGRSLRIKGTA